MRRHYLLSICHISIMYNNLSLCPAVRPDSARPGKVPLVLAGRVGRRDGGLLHIHPAAQVGGGARRLGHHRRTHWTARILYVDSFVFFVVFQLFVLGTVFKTTVHGQL